MVLAKNIGLLVNIIDDHCITVLWFFDNTPDNMYYSRILEKSYITINCDN